jgi:hypothetical protein
MWKWVKKAKDIYSWFGFISNILGWLGLLAIVSGTAATIAGVAGAMIKGLPWPFVLMAAYCTLVGMAYLAALPIFIKALWPVETADARRPQRVPPHYEAWKHVEKFTVYEAAYLWNDLEPNAKGNYTEVNAWVDAFCGAIRDGKLKFLPKIGSDFQRQRIEIANYQRGNADSSTVKSRDHLIEFAKNNNYHRKFLEG